MRRYWKAVLRFVLAAGLIFMLCSPAYAAAGREKINSVRLKVECDKKPEAGEDVGSVKVTVSDERIEVTEPAEYYDTDDDVWVWGEVPVIRLELSVKDEKKYYFSSSTKVTVSGFRSELKSKKVTHSGESLQIDIKLEKVTGVLTEPEDYYWEDSEARWSEVEGAGKYEVRLYRGNSLVTTITTSREKYDFYSYMNKAGDYSFRVRAIDGSSDKKGEWTDKSEEYSISEEEVYKGNTPGNLPENRHPSQSPGQPKYGWSQDSAGWTFRMEDGNLAKSRWLFVDNNWFYLMENGYMKTDWIYVDNNWFYLNPISDGTRGAMKTGWIYVDNNWFYLNPISDGARGAMKTGWIYVDNNWFYLNPISDGTRGAMKTGWQDIGDARYYLNPISDGTRGAMKTGYQRIDGRSYYFDTSDGRLWLNRNTPNGQYADGNGIIR